MSHISGLSRYQMDVMDRNYSGCNQCYKDRKKYEGGYPCALCTRISKTCTKQGVSQREAQDKLLEGVYGRNCFFAKYINRDGYYAIYSRDGCKYMQSLNDVFQPTGSPIFIGYDRDLDVSRVPYNIDFTIDDLINAGRLQVNQY